jgi:hypothetical protein
MLCAQMNGRVRSGNESHGGEERCGWIKLRQHSWRRQDRRINARFDNPPRDAASLENAKSEMRGIRNPHSSGKTLIFRGRNETSTTLTETAGKNGGSVFWESLCGRHRSLKTANPALKRTSQKTNRRPACRIRIRLKR